MKSAKDITIQGECESYRTIVLFGLFLENAFVKKIWNEKSFVSSFSSTHSTQFHGSENIKYPLQRFQYIYKHLGIYTNSSINNRKIYHGMYSTFNYIMLPYTIQQYFVIRFHAIKIQNNKFIFTWNSIFRAHSFFVKFRFEQHKKKINWKSLLDLKDEKKWDWKVMRIYTSGWYLFINC